MNKGKWKDGKVTKKLKTKKKVIKPRLKVRAGGQRTKNIKRHKLPG